MSSSISGRSTYITAAVTIARLAFRLPASTGPVPVKSIVRPVTVDVDRDHDRRAVVQMILEPIATIGQLAQRLPHLLLGGVLYMRHVRLHDRQRMTLDQTLQVARPLLIGRDLRRDVGQIVGQLARGILRRAQQVSNSSKRDSACARLVEISDQHPFFGQVVRERRHRARQNAADLGVVRTAGREEQQLPPGRIENRRHHGHVGQMRAAAIGIVGDVHIAGRRSRDCPPTSLAPFRPSRLGEREYAAR